MPPSLRKACHACTKSKRRCIPQLPSCDRCAKKQIPCVYDLEPVSQGETLSAGQQDLGGSGTGYGRENASAGEDTADFKIVYSSVKSAREVSMNAIANGYSATDAASRPMMFGSAELTQWVINFFIDVARDGAAGRGTPFIHAHILQSRPDEDEISTSTKITYFNRLTDIHNQIMHMLSLLLNNGKPTSKSSGTELSQHVDILHATTHTLWSSPPTHFDTSFTPWQSWLTAETIRRSMFAAHILKSLHCYLTLGYVSYEPFFESFPFDPRAGLWEAESEEEWEALVNGRYGGEHVKLKSYNEFVMGGTAGERDEEASDSLDPNEDGKFQRLLFLCFHCDAGVKYIRELEKRDARSSIT